MAVLWHELLDIGQPAVPGEVDLGGVTVRFVAGGPSAEWTVVLRRANADARDPGLPGIAFRLV
jgi:hypothetical protein